MQDRVLLPTGVLRALLKPAVDTAATLSEREIGWLRRLREGFTVARLAKHAGYSERMMFRLLADLYAKLRVANRTDAIVYAREQGWI
jgi:DNA-binding NarL/FixJ family response regulator